jgi:IstB-like ATP binding protein
MKTTVSAIAHERMEARLLRLQKQLACQYLLIIDKLGSIMITSNLFFDEWTLTFGTDRFTDALLDSLTHQVYILEKNGESYRFK